eukprot:scaffold2783_cov114-Cyclotella_meneghiniana.AAC.1
MDPSIYSVDSRGSQGSSAASYNSNTGRTPLRSNRSASGLGLPSATFHPVQLLQGLAEGGRSTLAGAPAAEDDFSIVSAMTGNTSRTLAGIKNVANAFKSPGFGVSFGGSETPSKSLMDSLMTPGQRSLEDDLKKLPSFLKSHEVSEDKQRGSLAIASSDPDACRVWLYQGSDGEELCLGAIGQRGL